MGLLFFAYRDFTSDADALLLRQGFGRAHHRVLYFVNLRPGMPVADLLDILKITKQSLARVLRQLIDNGYIEQKTGHSDRRQRLLHATDKGRGLFAALSVSQTRRINASIASLPPDSRKIVVRFLATMVEPEPTGRFWTGSTSPPGFRAGRPVRAFTVRMLILEWMRATPGKRALSRRCTRSKSSWSRHATRI
ncbi:MarR family winged helix-turn-helix transcriptional regulator [Paracoccus sp. (in: a-proteobacteria)]|uniref:MarR family winged helix-turn-helix transcriptional regulator n=1 Tax=Paracoccus sp. TaxID=267 RepID=UPI002AFF48F5|nr:MarR family transcriptional regulator [Paracoccus sp. (in: a-proteobacteria)]